MLLQIRRNTREKRGRFLTSTRFAYLADNLKKCIGEADDALGIVRGAATGALLQ
jgi:hypothetical protein